MDSLNQSSSSLGLLATCTSKSLPPIILGRPWEPALSACTKQHNRYLIKWLKVLFNWTSTQETYIHSKAIFKDLEGINKLSKHDIEVHF